MGERGRESCKASFSQTQIFSLSLSSFIFIFLLFHRAALELNHTRTHTSICMYMMRSLGEENMKMMVLNIHSGCCRFICTHTHTHTHTHAHTRTHTHTHVGFYGLRGLSIGVMVFILYKLYVLLPYTYPTPKLSPQRRRCISTFPPKNAHCMIYKHLKLWGH